jgi:hypothetical protein
MTPLRDLTPRPLPSSDPIHLDEELFYEDLQKEQPNLPAWRTLTDAQRGVVRTNLWNVWRASRVAAATILRKIAPDDMTAAERKAHDLGRGDLLRVITLPDNLGVVAYFASDRGLRSLGQTSLVTGDKPGYGLVIKADGTIPRDVGAAEILLLANTASRTTAQGEPS